MRWVMLGRGWVGERMTAPTPAMMMWFWVEHPRGAVAGVRGRGGGGASGMGPPRTAGEAGAGIFRWRPSRLGGVQHN